MRKAIACLLMLGLVCLTAWPCAADTNRTWTTHDAGTVIQFIPDSQEATFWEWPDLQNGAHRTGTLVLKNTAAREMTVRMDGAWLPFDDHDALTYLNFITLTIKDDAGQVLFCDRYVRLADWQTEIGTLAPQESVTWQVDMRCDFTYDGDAPMPQAITWMFAATPHGAAPSPDDLPVVPPAQTPWKAVILAAVAAVMLIGCVALRWRPKSHKNSKKA